ncbi:hypothetical protein [Parendozoicomonas haliclonae]|uniref:Preprotein translocase subunit YajC n=1 Tax=Parendozoicomonas haliclonae TaxID=1960125 RepID=A0A1X7AMX4_9GAMM|nr:hypothetical protein [Parendozoicomonas haliclonae]SMA47742.1 hypothetical protein EHSB41UT_02538 [Parendozoicomonas haliclonae]
MIWLIILLVILFIAGNILWLLPSSDERRRMKLRTEAMGRGLSVRMPPMADDLPEACAKPRSQWYEYGLLAVSPDNALEERQAWLNHAKDTGGHDELFALLRDMPEGVMRVKHTPEGLFVLWNEQGDSADLEHIITLLNDNLRQNG